MKLSKTAAAIALGAIFSTGALAQGYGGQGGHGGYGHGPSQAPAAYSNGYGNGHGNGYGQGRGLERRDMRNLHQIEHGVRTGQLSPREAGWLRSRQTEIDRMEAVARRDGFVGQHEREHIRVAQEQLSRDIWRASHNNRVARY